MDNAVDEDWRVLQSLFPSGWGEQAKTAGAMERGRGITSPELLLRLFLLHVGKGYSLRETSVRAKKAKLSEISDVGLLKRLRRSEAWLRWLCVKLLAENGVDLAGHNAGQRNVRVVDATVVKEQGKTGSEWRILYSLRLPDLECDFFELSSTAGAGNGESFSRIPVARQDLLLADAGYSKAPGIQSVVGQGADVLVRLNPQSLPLLDENGAPLELLAKLRTLQVAGQIGEWKATPAGTQVSGRICAVRKSEEAIRRARRRIQQRASKRQTRTKPETREYAQYVVVFTTELSSAAAVVLEWYRVRWQIGVSRQGHIVQSVKDRPRPKGSGLVAWEAPWRESKTAEPSDNMLRKECAQRTRLQRTVNADVASLHEFPVAETVDNARKQQGLAETSPMRQLSPAGYQR